MTPSVVIVGAGVAGLATARALAAARPDAQITVLERTRRAGGLVETELTAAGLVVEHGADCLVTIKPQGLAAIHGLGLDGEVVPSATKPSYVASADRLVAMPRGVFPPSPASAGPLAASELFSAEGKARMLIEPLMEARRADGDESVASFVRRRWGDELLDRAIGPLLTLIYGTPADRLSVRAALPRLAELEREHGSVARGLAAKTGTAPPPHGGMISFKRGMSTLTDAMARSVDKHIRYGVDVRAVERRSGGGYLVRTLADGVLEADAVVVAVPAYAAARLVDGLDAELAAMLAAVEHGRLDIATLAWARSSIPHPMNGTGFVVAAAETPRAITGCTWTSESWPGRAPEGLAMLRCFAAEEDASDEELLAAMRRDLRDLMGIECAPVMLHLRRRARVLPRYEVGCMDRIAAMRDRAAGLAGFALAGNAHGGVGIPDCIESGEAAALAVNRFFAGHNDTRHRSVARTKSVATPVMPR